MGESITSDERIEETVDVETNEACFGEEEKS